MNKLLIEMKESKVKEIKGTNSITDKNEKIDIKCR
jgi:hypothetical protein